MDCGGAGFALLRSADDEVLHNLEGVLETIRLKLNEAAA
jgi:very-short-patch-repair endonuclease